MAWPVSTRATDDLITPAIWNADLVANMNAVFRSIPKTADENVASSITPQNDDHLLLAMLANEYYAVSGAFWHSNSTASVNIRFAFTVPASATYHIVTYGADTAGTFAFANHRSSADQVSFFTGSTGNMTLMSGVVVCAGTAGNFQMQWAQGTSNASATTMKKGSWLGAAKLG